MRALAVGGELGAANRALIKYLMYILRADRGSYADVVFLLPCVVVIHKRILYPLLNLCGGKLCNLLTGLYLNEVRLYRDLDVRVLSPLRASQEVAP